MRNKKSKKVISAMSGGTDSSVTTALLKKKGFDVIGIFMKFWSPPQKNGLIGKGNRCCSPEAEKRARKIADLLNIPFYVLDLREQFKRRIVDRFLKEYQKGRTPNPCVICNKEIKFGLLLEQALKLEADFLATGHYARIQKKKDRFYLEKGKDKNKDQSYFLWQLDQKQLSKTLFPLAEYTKKKVKSLAVKFNLPVLNIQESQEICFIQKSTEKFLKEHLELEPGKIIDDTGKELGTHQGLALYTIGQRKRIKLSGGPFYVYDKEPEENILRVTKNKKKLYQKEVRVENINWILEVSPKLPQKAKAKIRYRHKASPVIIHHLGKKTLHLVFKKKQRAITPGQSAVFYKGKELLGGGIIC